MADLTAADVKNVTDEIQTYSDQVDSIAKSNGIEVKVAGNDPAAVTKAVAGGAATGAAVAATFAAAAGPFAPAVVAAGAIIGAIAAFFSSFKFGPSAEAIALTKEFDGLNVTIHGVLAKVPQPSRDQIALLIINAMKRQPGPLPFCLEGGGCAMTSIKGVRDAAAGLNDQIKNWLAMHAEKPSRFTARRVGLGVLALGGLGFAGYKLWERENKR